MRGDLVVLEQAHRLAQQGAADPLPLDELRLGPHQLSGLEALGKDGAGDVAGHRLCPLALARFGQDNRVRQELFGVAAAPVEVGLGLEVLAHPALGQPGFTRHDGLGDLGVGVLGVLPHGRPELLLPARRVELGHPVEDVDEELEPGVPADGRDQCVQFTRVVLGGDGLLRREAPQLGQVVLVGAFGCQLAGDLLEDDPGLEDLVQPGVDPMQVEDDRVGHRAHGRLGDDQTAAGSTARAGDLLVLDEADRLAEDGPAHLVALEEVRLRAEHLAHRPAQGHDVLDDQVGHLGRPLGIGLCARPRHCRGRRRSHEARLPVTRAVSTPVTCAFGKRVVRNSVRFRLTSMMKT